MSFTWPQLHEHFLRSSSTLGFQRDFDTIRRRHAHLHRFTEPAALLDMLHHGRDAPNSKNLILIALVEAAQGQDAVADSALALVLLALWPGLDAILRRSRKRRLAPADELPCDVIARATETVRCLDLGRVRRVAATILRNVERDLVRAKEREDEHRRRFVPDDDDAILIPDAMQELPGSLDHLRADIVRVVGEDAPIVMRVGVEGHTHAEVAAAFGLSEAAASKRYQRACRRLREQLRDAA